MEANVVYCHMKIDGRELTHEALETIRILAVRRVEEGEAPSAVIESFGFCRTTIYRWLRAAKRGGEAALKSRKAPGPPSLLNERRKAAVARWITGKDPRQYGFDFGLWTRKIVSDLIERKFGVRMSVTAVGRLLAELGITPQKPLRRAYERDPKAVARWLKEDYPRIRRNAKRRGADIFFLDEAGVRSDSALGRTWAPKGQTPIVTTSGRRQSVNAISALTSSGAFWFDVFPGRLNAVRFVELLKKFLRRRRRPVVLVLDSHPAHVAKLVAEFVQSQRGRLEIHFLPGYAPDLNPDEFVWKHLKSHGLAKRPLGRGESLQARVIADLRAIKANVGLVRSFFRAPTVAYVAD
jgi:transposase